MPDPSLERTATGKPVTNTRVKRQACEFKLGEEVTRIMIHQLRTYEIFEHNKSAFHARFRDHAMRIMRNYGFDIVAMWETANQQRTEFVYLLAWPDEAAKNAAWAQFRADEEWKEIKRVTSAKHGDLVGSIEDRVLFLTDYSPPLSRSS
jgi:heme-degrading monooxygenase HmoA